MTEAEILEDFPISNARTSKPPACGDVLTKDEDFAVLARGSATALIVIWLRNGNCSNAGLRAWLEPRLSGIVHLVEQGGRVIEVI